MRLNQVTIPVTNVPRSVEFYTRLGLLRIVDSADYARFELPEGDSTFSVHRVDQTPPPSEVTIYFECDGLDEKVEVLRESGIQFTSGPADMSWLWREARLLPRSRADERRLESARRRLTRELGIARRSARWLAPADEP